MEENNQRAVSAMKLPCNARCAECFGPNPVWSSPKLGIFICIRCSYAHYYLGHHISLVRSVFLDRWSDKDVFMVENIGNEKSNRYWEAKLPCDFNRPFPNEESKFKEFIRQKYEEKRWVDPGSISPLEELSDGKKI